MQVISLLEVKDNIKDIFESVYNEEVIIHREGRESVVVISLDEFNSLKETTYLLYSPAKHLLNSLEELRSGKL